TGGDGEAALNGGTRAELVEPALEIFELPDVLTLRLPADRPGIGDHVGDRVFVAGDIVPVIKPVVEHAIEPVRFVGEAADGVGLVALLVPETSEVPALAELRPLIGHLPEHPLIDLVAGAKVLRIEAPGLLREIHHDRAGLEDADRGPAVRRRVVYHRRHAVVRADLQKLVLELVPLADVGGHDGVGHAELFEEDRDLLAVRGRSVVKMNHGGPPIGMTEASSKGPTRTGLQAAQGGRASARSRIGTPVACRSAASPIARSATSARRGGWRSG